MKEDDANKTVIHDANAPDKTGVHTKRDACLIVIAGGTVGMMHKLPSPGEIVIGRTGDAAIQLDDDGVSRKHASISITPNRQVILNDLGSTNGTFVNGDRVTEKMLKDGDKVQIGPQAILKFQYQDALDEEFQRILFERAVKDGLTGIYNKKYFLDRLGTDFSYAKRHKTSLALIMFDIDHFKKINDGHGHPAGDYVLQRLTAQVKRTVRNEDAFARYGGEEFAILMRDTGDEKAIILAERIRLLVQQTVFEFEGKRIPVTVSLGVGTTQSSPVESPADLVTCADQCLYNAKQGGRNRVSAREK
ncbi:MAG TPA: GGDEF domain-containing protein [Burkholderiales bacterium]|nr:GGDEF domain-containing protein [Burkholderiales bacterium]